MNTSASVISSVQAVGRHLPYVAGLASDLTVEALRSIGSTIQSTASYTCREGSSVAATLRNKTRSLVAIAKENRPVAKEIAGDLVGVALDSAKLILTNPKTARAAGAVFAGCLFFYGAYALSRAQKTEVQFTPPPPPAKQVELAGHTCVVVNVGTDLVCRPVQTTTQDLEFNFVSRGKKEKKLTESLFAEAPAHLAGPVVDKAPAAVVVAEPSVDLAAAVVAEDLPVVPPADLVDSNIPSSDRNVRPELSQVSTWQSIKNWFSNLFTRQTSESSPSQVSTWQSIKNWFSSFFSR